MPDSGNRGWGLVSNIQKFSVHDGKGIRTLVFMKGCPLCCKWCSNPETQKGAPEITYNQARCIGYEECGKCKQVCPADAITIQPDGKVQIEHKLCNNCGRCVEVCPAKAIRLCGEYMTVDMVVKAAEEDSIFYSRSGGGITIGGGEPLFQAEFVHELLKECKERGIDTAIETCGFGRWEDLEKICRYCNFIFYDIKCLDSGKHRAFTGAGNELILENINRISRAFPQIPIVARTPVVPGVNGVEADIEAIAEFLAEIKGVREYELLPYHGFGEPKYHQLGREYPLSNLRPLSQGHMVLLRRVARKVTEWQ